MGRPIWTGSISFGIVNIPVKLYSAVRDRSVHFHQVSASHKKRIRYKKVAEGTDDEVAAADIIKAFEVSKGRYVTIDEGEMAKLAAGKSKTIDIIDFVALDEIDPLFFEQPYYLAPDERAGRSFWLLVDALEQSGRVAIAQFVMRSKEYLGALRPVDGMLCLETMRYEDEIVRPQDLDEEVLKREEPRERELAVAMQLIDSMTTGFDPARYKDQYRERVLSFVEKKAEGKGAEILEDEEWTESGKPRKGEVIDLMAALEKSLAHAGRAKSGGPSRAKAAPRHKPRQGHAGPTRRGPKDHPKGKRVG
ncbi:MAG: Ku protein [Planctomycetes bacterium]|nr:Ku protein [Planctomycetota bacterium]